tara:strand:+ start:777 stop:2753 length:1977 start_codon:yes stop_codon:yes gene_type:complete
MEAWQTFPIEFRGGLVTNLSPLQQGINAPGSARILRNFEPSIEGGYRRILGFAKYDSNIIPPYGAPVVHGASQSGTTLIIGNIHKIPEAGDTLTVAGVTGTYTIAVGGVSYDATNRRATLTLTVSLASSPANAAAITFTSTSTDHITTGAAVFENAVLVQRNFDVFKTTGSGYTHINVPNYGTVLVNGASQTGSSLAIDALTAAPQAGDVFKIAGVNLVYTVTADATVSSGGSTVNINPALASSPANNAAITFLSTSRVSAIKLRFTRYNFNGTDKIMLVDGVSVPAIYDGTSFTALNSAPSDVVGATHTINFKNTLFFAKGSAITFTAVYTDTDFSAANGAGTINVGSNITGLSVFRETLFIFTEDSIFRISGSTIADFKLDPVTRDIGCIEGDSIQEIGSDVMFLGPDGLRLLSATERIGDFNFSNASKVIQSEFTNFVSSSTNFCSIVLRSKSQYRIMGYSDLVTKNNAKGFLTTQLAEEGGGGFAFAETRGIQAYVADSYLNQNVELAVFANKDGYLYQVETGNSFDGANILATFSTPHMPVSDPRVRKTFYKMFLYTDPQGSVDFDTALKLDFDGKDTIQPDSITFNNAATTAPFYGVSTYGTAVFGNQLQYVFESQLIGSGYTGSLQFTSDSTGQPFSLDAVTLEYGTNARR